MSSRKNQMGEPFLPKKKVEKERKTRNLKRGVSRKEEAKGPILDDEGKSLKAGVKH